MVPEPTLALNWFWNSNLQVVIWLVNPLCYSPQLLLQFAAQKLNNSIKDFFSKYDQIRSFLQIWLHLLKKTLMRNFIFCAVRNFKKIREKRCELTPFWIEFQHRTLFWLNSSRSLFVTLLFNTFLFYSSSKILIKFSISLL